MTDDPREAPSPESNNPLPAASSLGDKLQRLALLAPERLRAIEMLADVHETAVINKLHRILVIHPQAIHTIEALLDRLLDTYVPRDGA